MQEKEKKEVIEYFQSRGWIVVYPHEVDRVATKNGEELRCGDDGYGVHSPLAPAVFGAVEGVAAHVQGTDSIVERFRVGIEIIERSGYLPASHGDLLHGDLDGCKFRKAWMEGKFSWLPAFSRRDAKEMRFINEIHHHTLNRKRHTGEGLLLNFEPDSTVIPHGRFYVNDLWFLKKLGFKLEDILKISIETAELVLPIQEQRKLLIY